MSIGTHHWHCAGRRRRRRRLANARTCRAICSETSTGGARLRQAPRCLLALWPECWSGVGQASAGQWPKRSAHRSAQPSRRVTAQVCLGLLQPSIPDMPPPFTDAPSMRHAHPIATCVSSHTGSDPSSNPLTMLVNSGRPAAGRVGARHDQPAAPQSSAPPSKSPTLPPADAAPPLPPADTALTPPLGATALPPQPADTAAAPPSTAPWADAATQPPPARTAPPPPPASTVPPPSADIVPLSVAATAVLPPSVDIAPLSDAASVLPCSSTTRDDEGCGDDSTIGSADGSMVSLTELPNELSMATANQSPTLPWLLA